MTALNPSIRNTLSEAVPPAVTAMSEHLRAERTGVAAILAYGSCLRGMSPAETLIDLYLIVEHDSDVSVNALSRIAARLMPPNVYYAQCAWNGHVLRCKYAVIAKDTFVRRMQRNVTNPYFWARFAQPARLTFAANETTRDEIVAAIADAVTTMYAAGLAAARANADVLAIWQQGFEETYQTELRPEASSRAFAIVAANAGFYREMARLLWDTAPLTISWRRERLVGKLLSILRLAKAAFTFEGGADYAAWKIERHTGKKIAVSDWQRRHPLLAGLMMLPLLLRRGALR